MLASELHVEFTGHTGRAKIKCSPSFDVAGPEPTADIRHGNNALLNNEFATGMSDTQTAIGCRKFSISHLHLKLLRGHLLRLLFATNVVHEFTALEEALKLLNPGGSTLNFQWEAAEGSGWIINISDNRDLDNLAPLCGLDINSLDAGNIGTPDLQLLSGNGMRRLALSGSPLSHLFDMDRFAGVEELDISGTRIRNLANIVKYNKLTTLDISRIEGLVISPQLVWCRNLKVLTVSQSHRDDPTIRALARRGVIIIYAGN